MSEVGLELSAFSPILLALALLLAVVAAIAFELVAVYSGSTGGSVSSPWV